MSGDVKQGWIDNPKALKKVLAEVLCLPAPKQEFKVWKTIKLGTFKNAADFYCALKKADCNTRYHGHSIFGTGFTVSFEENEISLVRVSVEELGFKEGATHESICRRAQALGLDLCPAEVGPQLRLQYKNQPKGQFLLIGMLPIIGWGSSLGVFWIHRTTDDKADSQHGEWIIGNDGGTVSFSKAEDLWVFKSRK